MPGANPGRTRPARPRVAPVMRRTVLLLVVLLTAALAAGLIARAGASTPTTQFRSPDAGAACKLERAALTCATLGSPVSVVLHPSGPPTNVNELPWWDASTPVLHTWHRSTISCRLAGSAILCRTNRGAIQITAAGFAAAAA
jgi:hypothetical protein